MFCKSSRFTAVVASKEKQGTQIKLFFLICINIFLLGGGGGGLVYIINSFGQLLSFQFKLQAHISIIF